MMPMAAAAGWFSGSDAVCLRHR